MAKHRWVLLVALVIAVGGCAVDREMLMELSKAPPVPKEYRIGPSDTVMIEFRMHPEFNRQLIVGPHGKIELPEVGEYDLFNKTTTEVAGELNTLYEKLFTVPKVSVTVVSYRSKVVYVAGEVNRPAIIPYDRRMHLVDAIMLAGGPTLRAQKDRVRLVRMSLDKPKVILCDFKKAMCQGEGLHNPRLEYGDIIYVDPTPLTAFGYALNELLFPFTSIFTGLEQSSSAKFTLRNYGGEGVGR